MEMQSLQPSPDWIRAMPPGPDARVKITEEYARHVGRDAYFWAWPLVNMYNRNSANRYAVTFAKGATPPVNGFWSLSIYNEHHFFVKNAINRFSVGAKNKDLELAADGSLTIYVQADAPTDSAQRANWLPAPKGDFSLFMRAYWPTTEIAEGSWTPPAVRKVN